MTQLKLEKIWDPVTRLWHWALVLSVTLGWSFGKFMSFSTIDWHFYLGYCTGGLILFRYFWGFVGPQPIRFRSILPRPSALRDYLRGVARREPSGSPGHNPLGSLAVIAIILLLSVQATSGLFVESDDFFESGPLAGYVSNEMIRSMTWLHRLVADWVLIIVLAHVSAVLFYLWWKRENLIKPMFTGWKWVKREAGSIDD